MSQTPKVDTSNKKSDLPEQKVEKTPEEIQELLYSDLKNYCEEVNKTGLTKELRFLSRSLRQTFARLRRKLTDVMVAKILVEYFPEGEKKMNLLKYFPEQPEKVETMKVEGDAKTQTETTKPEFTPELEIFLCLIVAVFLIDKKAISDARVVIEDLVEYLGTFNRRTLDPLSAKVYYYYSLVAEKEGRLADIRVKLLQLQRTATLRHNFSAQIVLLNLLLRNYLHYNLYDQAEKLASKTEFPEQKASTNEAARYHFYLGRINAIQLSYTAASINLQKALRKGPRDSASGFRSIATKFLIVVQLLLGEIPERAVFRTKGVGSSLVPYLKITQAVRSGSVSQFQQVLVDCGSVFKADNVYLLVQRLHHTVIKTGLKKICVSYSRISFKDICTRLNLGSEKDAEYIVAKAIRDGIIDATINHTEGYIQSTDQVDIYSTSEPQKGFHVRIEFCNQIHNDAVKAMRYPPDSWKQEKQDKSVFEETFEDLVGSSDDEDED